MIRDGLTYLCFRLSLSTFLPLQVERLRKIEMASDMDEILKEEIREYKETLTCPSCKVKRKDAVLTKCFHCFCYDCLRTRLVACHK